MGPQLAGQGSGQGAQFLRDRRSLRHRLETRGDRLAAGPGELLGLGPLRQRQVAQAESRQCIVLELEGVVPGLLKTLRNPAVVGVVAPFRPVASDGQGEDAFEGVTQVAQDQGFGAAAGVAVDVATGLAAGS
jgi:hypothetical protein